MVVTPDTVITGVDPFDISEEKFAEVMRTAGSPAANSYHDAYMILGTFPVSIAAMLAVFHHESTYATNPAAIVVKHDTKNPGNCRSTRTGVGTVISTARGPFVKYPSWTEGWRDLAWRLVDPNYVYVKEGRNTIREIIERFAPASDNNSPNSYIAAVVKDMNAWATEEPPMGTPYDHIIPGMIDARAQLSTATQGQGGVVRGPYETIPLSAKRGVVVHYRGVVTDVNAGLASFKADATYHVGKNWARNGETPVLGSGIMYHVGIDGQGNVYLLRDLDRVLWHCGAWPQNENTLAIQLPLGGSQKATKPQLAALNRVVNDWRSFSKAPKAEVWGHQELSGTTCPGTLMDDFVKPYRAGSSPAPNPPAGPWPTVPPAIPDPHRGSNPYGNSFWVPKQFVVPMASEPFMSHGFIVSEAFAWTNPAGEALIIQYCERTRWELHQDGSVTRGLVGLEAMHANHPERQS